MEPDALLRIGELSRRLNVSTHVLRAWESRYGLLTPARTPSGYRLYGPEDESRVRQMQILLASGQSAAQAAAAILARPAAPTRGVSPTDRPAALRRGLRAALDARSDQQAGRRLDEAVSQLGLPLAITDVVLPYLRDVGERWSRGDITIAEEHFASNVVRTRLASYAGAWGSGTGPVALLACPTAEQHDLPLLAFGLMLRRRGWRIQYLGARTPITDLISFVGDTTDRVVLAATTTSAYEQELPDLRRLAERVPVALAGAGASASLAQRIGPGARVLPADMAAAMDQLAAAATDNR